MGETVTLTFQVQGMHCSSCGMLIDEVVEDVDGVVRSNTRLKAARAVVELDPQRCGPDDVIAAIAGAGYEARWEQP